MAASPPWGQAHIVVASGALQRFAIDAMFIFVACLVVFWLKERFIHRRDLA